MLGLANEVDVNQERSSSLAIRRSFHSSTRRLALPPTRSPCSSARRPRRCRVNWQRCQPRQTTTPEVGQELPAGLPSDLLRRRPDVRAAERRLAAATARSASPSRSFIRALISSQRPRLRAVRCRIFSPCAISRRLGIGDVMWPVFAGGKLRANVRATEEERVQAYLAYQSSVLAALQDAESAIIRCTTEEQRLA
jgi:hypothetical protein